MNREILFRGREWNADLERLHFVYGYLIDKDVIKNNLGHPYVVHEDTIGQYTGLTDKNGVKIFEGDKVSYKQKYNSHISNCEVIFKNGGFELHHGNLIYERISTVLKFGENLEVIGNIHDK